MDFALTLYYCREKYFHTMQRIAESASRNSSDGALKLQYCIALILQSKIGEALRELESLLVKPDVGLAVILASIHAQNLCEVPDGEALVILENRLKNERKRASELSLYYAAVFLLQIGDYSKTREYEEMLFRVNRNTIKGYLIKGWLELNAGKLTKAADCFRTVLAQDGQNFDAAIGEVLSVSRDDSIPKLNQMIVKYPKLTPPLIEKMKLVLMDKDWDQATDIVARILTLEESNIPALQVNILNQVCNKGNYDVIEDIEKLLYQIKTQEPASWMLSYEFGTSLSRACGGNSGILKQCVKFLQQAVRLVPDDIGVNLELAYQHFLLKNYQEAVTIYKNAARLDDTATEALIGLTRCHLESGSKESVKEQIDFLLDVYNAEPNPDILLLKAAFEVDSRREELIEQAVELKMKSSSGIPFGIKFLASFDTNFILDALKKLPSSTTCNNFKINVLKRIVDTFPGLIEGWLQLGNVYIDSQDDKNAEEVLYHLVKDFNSSNADANLIYAQVLIKQKKFSDAESTLDACLSHNLNIRSKPLFHFLQGRIHKHRSNFTGCVESLETALNCISENEPLKTLDLAALYLDLSSSYQILRQAEKATEAVQKATQLLQGTSQEDQIIMARVDLELWKNDVDKALSLLSTISSDSPIYLEARTKMADIYLKQNKDTKKFIECFKELAERYPTQENLIKLADAYFSIREINEAVEIYEKAIKKKPSPQLSKKLAELYYKCHQYGKAMRCYREAGAEGSLDLAQLLFALEQWEMAEVTLNHVPLQNKATLLAKIKEKLGDIPEAVSILNEAYKKIGTGNPSLATQICCQMAEYEASLHDFEAAIRHYKLALSHCQESSSPENIAIQIALSKLYLQVNDWGSCQSICASLLSKDENNELALLMSADLSFRKCDFFSASNLFHKLLTQKPDYWLALARMIEVKRRMAVLKDVVTYLQNAAALSRSDSGLAYCTGLYDWYNNDFMEALKFFNCVKHDPEWGQQAVHNMVEIYLILNDQETAERLLQEIHPNSPEEETNRSLLVNFVLLAAREKQLIDKAMNELTLLASRDVLRVGASLGLAMGYMMQKQPQRARNVLKIIAKTAWQFEEAEYLERCWLMLAEHYVQSGKHELAYELIKKILTYNQGCSKAHELLGMIAEKDQKELKYGDATSHYVKAWNLSGQNDPFLGYKLGTYFIKAKKYADAIATCQTIFKKNLDNGKLRKEIYEKAISLLRT